MSKVIFFGFPAYGHTYPTLGLVKELCERGEQVIYYSHHTLREMIESTGAEFRGYRSGILLNRKPDEEQVDVSGYEKLLVQAKVIIPETKAVVESLLDEVWKENPDYIIHDSYAYWGKVMVGLLGLPGISSVTVFAYSEKVVAADPDMFFRCALRLSNEELVKKRNSSSPLKILDTLSRYVKNGYELAEFRILDLIASCEKLNIVYTSREFQLQDGLFDDSYKFVGPSIRPKDPDEDFPLDRLTGEKPLVYISLGTVFTQRPEFFKKCIQALKNTELQVVMSIGKSLEISVLGEIPDNFIVRNHVPQIEILKRASVFVSHAGFNSISESVYFFVPLVLFPQSVDQFLVAERMEALGLGLYNKNPDLTPAELFQLIEKVRLDTVCRSKCVQFADSFKTAGGVKRAVDEIFAFKAKRGTETNAVYLR